MKKAFLEKFFPTSRIIVLRKKISGIQQGPGESFPVLLKDPRCKVQPLVACALCMDTTLINVLN
ncbi:unnamed protein product [Prunus brigantina]